MAKYTVEKARNILDGQAATLDGFRAYSERLRQSLPNIRIKRGSGLLYGLGEYHSSNAVTMGVGTSLLPVIVEGAVSQLRDIGDRAISITEQYYALISEIDGLQFGLLSRVRPNHIYVEGKQSVHRATSHYRSGLLSGQENSCLRRLQAAIFRMTHGSKVTYLDEDNPYYDELVDSKPPEDVSKELQQKRESVWAERIAETVSFASLPVIIAGSAHIRNDFGLPDTLNRKGITLEELVA